MSQQINLFNPLFLRQKKYFSVATMVQAIAVLVAGLAVFVGYATVQDRRLADRAEESARSYALQKDRFVRVSAELAPGKGDTQLEEDLRAAESEVGARQNFLRELQTGAMGNTRGYSEYLRAFARQTLTGLWLVGIRISEGGEQLALAGRALQPELLPEYIGRLNAEVAMRGRPFDSLSITRAGARPAAAAAAQAAPAGVEFRLSSGAGGPEWAAREPDERSDGKAEKP